MPYRPDIVSLLQARRDALTPVEQRIADCVIQDVAFAARASIGALAARAGVGPASVTRFARAVGCEDVRDLKLRLAQSVAVGERFLDDRAVPPGAAGRLFDAVSAALAQCAHDLASAPVAPAAERLSLARQVLVVGVGGGSTAMAMECQYRLFRLGVPAMAYSDPVLMRMAASTLEPTDAVILLSLSGHGPDLPEVAKIAAEAGAACIAITSAASPLAACADYLLPITLSERDEVHAPTSARYALLACVDVLATELALLQPRRTRERLRRIKHHLDAYRGGGDRLPLGD